MRIAQSPAGSLWRDIPFQALSASSNRSAGRTLRKLRSGRPLAAVCLVTWPISRDTREPSPTSATRTPRTASSVWPRCGLSLKLVGFVMEPLDADVAEDAAGRLSERLERVGGVVQFAPRLCLAERSLVLVYDGDEPVGGADLVQLISGGKGLQQ